MGKKPKKNRFNKTVDVDVIYSSNTIAEVDPTDNMVELNLSKERAEELRKIRAQLPTFSQSTLLESEMAKLPTTEPFRAFVHNMAFSATADDVTRFFLPLAITNVNLVCGETGSRGFCFVDFATQDDLAKALERNESPLSGRPVNVRIADTNSNDRGGRDRNAFGGMRRGDGGFDRRRGGGYRPAGLREDDPDYDASEAGEWRRGTAVNRAAEPRPAFGSSSSFGRQSEFSRGPPIESAPTVHSERPKINLLPRSSEPVTTTGRSAGPRNSKIFGDAKPVDTASRDRALEQRIGSTGAPSVTVPQD